MLAHLPRIPLVFLVGSVTLLVVTLSGMAGEPAENAGPSLPIEQRIQQLGSTDFLERETASKALLGLGVEALPELRKAQQSADPEVRRRLEEVIPAIERAETLAPKRVTLHLTQRPLREAVAEVSRQTGYKLLLSPDARGNGERERFVYDFHFDKLTFWDAVEKICLTGGLVVQQNHYGDDGLRLQFGEDYVPFLCSSGPFRVVAQRLDYGRNIQLGALPRTTPWSGQQTAEYLTFTLSIAAEPKLPLLRVGPVRLAAAYDSQNQSLLPDPVTNALGTRFGGQRFYSGGGYRSYTQQAQVGLGCPSRTARAIRLLKGFIPVTLLTKQDPLLVTSQLLESKGKKLKAGDTVFTVEEASQTPAKQYRIKLAIQDDNKQTAGDFNRIHTLYQRIEVQDLKGKKYQLLFNSLGTSGPSTAQMTFSLDGSGQNTIGPPAKLIYYAWSTMEHEVAFEFRDLPLP